MITKILNYFATYKFIIFAKKPRMHYYNNKNFFKILFSLNKSDTMKVLAPSLLGIALYSLGIYYLEIEYFKLTENSPIKNVNILHSLLGFVLSLLLVFRTNTAYD